MASSERLPSVRYLPPHNHKKHPQIRERVVLLRPQRHGHVSGSGCSHLLSCCNKWSQTRCLRTAGVTLSTFRRPAVCTPAGPCSLQGRFCPSSLPASDGCWHSGLVATSLRSPPVFSLVSVLLLFALLTYKDSRDGILGPNWIIQGNLILKFLV